MSFSKLALAATAVLATALAVTGIRTFLNTATAPTARPGALTAQSGPAARGQHIGAGITPGPEDALAQSSQSHKRPRRPPERGSERFQLENGLTVILRPIRTAKSSALVILYSIGSDHDPEGLSGLAHTLEHVYVTAAAGQAPARTARDLAARHKEGANGQTGDRYTVLSSVFPEEDLDRELKEAAARMGDLHVTAADLDRERPRLLQEVANMFGGIPALGAINSARELVRPTPRGGRHGGLPEHLRKITADQVQSHWQRYYKPRNAILSLAGAFDPAAVRTAITAHFAKLPTGEEVDSPPEPGRPRFGTNVDMTVNTRIPDAGPTGSLAYPAPAPSSELYAAFLVLVSRLWAAGPRLEGDGPAGSPVFFTPLDDGAVVAVSAAAKPGENSAKTFARIEAFVAQETGRELWREELSLAREQLSLFLGTTEIPDDVLAQNPYGMAFCLGRREQLDMNPAQLNRALDAVTDAGLRRVAAEVFAPSRHAGAFITIKP
jgi:zinc protease